MSSTTDYTPPAVWTWNKANGSGAGAIGGLMGARLALAGADEQRRAA